MAEIKANQEGTSTSPTQYMYIPFSDDIFSYNLSWYSRVLFVTYKLLIYMHVQV